MVDMFVCCGVCDVVQHEPAGYILEESVNPRVMCRNRGLIGKCVAWKSIDNKEIEFLDV